MPKNCINCGCAISGEGKNKVFCDECLRKISPFLKFISTSKVPAVKLYEANEEKLREMGLSDMSLAYLSKCCSSYDEKRTPAEPSVLPPILSMESDGDTITSVDVSDNPVVEETDDDFNLDGIAVVPLTSDDVDEITGEDYSDEGDKDSGKRLAIVIIAALLTLLIFLVLYIGHYIPGYTPDIPETNDKTDTVFDTNDDHTDTSDVDETTDMIDADDTSDTDDTDTADTDDTDDTEEPVTSDSDTDSDEVPTECVHEWIDATCTEPKTCSLCGATEGDPIAHDYANATCTEPQTCTHCGATVGSALGHNYKAATCTADSVCSRCGKTVQSALGHNYKAATCTNPQTCTRCGATTGSALGHNYKAATCTDPSTCSRCGATVGSALGHDYIDGIKCSSCGAYKISTTAVGTSITDAEGLTLNVTSITSKVSGNNSVYTIKFTATNSTEKSLAIGFFRLFYADSDGNISGASYEVENPYQWGGFEPDSSESFTYTITIPSNATPLVLEYYDQYELEGMSKPHASGTSGAFFWKVS